MQQINWGHTASLKTKYRKNVPIVVKKKETSIIGSPLYWQPRKSQPGSEIVLSGSSKVGIICCSVNTASCVLVTVFIKAECTYNVTVRSVRATIVGVEKL